MSWCRHPTCPQQGDALVESLRAKLAEARENARPDEPGEALNRVAEFQRLDMARQRVVRAVMFIVRML
jgi:hypothetical protein